MLLPNTKEARLAVNDRLVAARQACQSLIDELKWLDTHYEEPVDRLPLHDILSEINKGIELLWDLSDENFKASYKHYVARRVLD